MIFQTHNIVQCSFILVSVSIEPLKFNLIVPGRSAYDNVVQIMSYAIQYSTISYAINDDVDHHVVLRNVLQNIFRLRWNYGRCATYFVVSAIWKSNFLRYGKRFQFLLLKNCPLLLNWPFAMLKNHWKVHQKEKKKIL